MAPSRSTARRAKARKLKRAQINERNVSEVQDVEHWDLISRTSGFSGDGDVRLQELLRYEKSVGTDSGVQAFGLTPSLAASTVQCFWRIRRRIREELASHLSSLGSSDVFGCTAQGLDVSTPRYGKMAGLPDNSPSRAAAAVDEEAGSQALEPDLPREGTTHIPADLLKLSEFMVDKFGTPQEAARQFKKGVGLICDASGSSMDEAVGFLQQFPEQDRMTLLRLLAPVLPSIFCESKLLIRSAVPDQTDVEPSVSDDSVEDWSASDDESAESHIDEAFLSAAKVLRKEQFDGIWNAEVEVAGFTCAVIHGLWLSMHHGSHNECFTLLLVSPNSFVCERGSAELEGSRLRWCDGDVWKNCSFNG